MKFFGAGPGLEFKRTIGNATSVVGGEVLLKVANFVAVVVIGRLYGPATLGLYAAVLAFATVAVMIAEGGLQLSTISEIGRAPERVNQLFGQLYALRVALFLMLLLALSVIGRARHWESYIWMVGGLIVVRTMLYSCSQLQFAVLKSLDRMKVIGMIQAVSFVVLCAGIWMTYASSWSFVALLWCFIVSHTVEITLTLVLLFRSGIRPIPLVSTRLWTLLKASAPIGATYLMAGIILRADVIVLASIGSNADVGRFAAANVGIVFVYAVSWLLASVLLADQVRLLRFPSEALSYIRLWRKVLLLVALPSSLILCWLAPRIVRVLYGKGFESAGLLASVMVLAVPFILLNGTYLSRAMALGAKRVYLGTYLGTAITAVCLDLILGHLYGAIGVASAIVLREILMFLAFRALDGLSSLGSPAIESTVVDDELLETIDG